MADMPEPEHEENEQVIIPHFKMIISYDVLPSSHENYYQFVLGEMVPAMQEMGVYMTEAWHTAYGEYPIRMVSFVSEDIETINDMLGSDRWQDLETRLQSFIRNYSRKIVEYRQGFQFISTS
jgi:hypothetical protein